MVDLVDGHGLPGDHAREAARRDDLHGMTVLLLDAAHDAVDLADVAEDDARLHALDGVAADDLLRRHELDARQLRSAREERVRRGAEARRDDAAEEVAVRVDDVERRRRADVDDDERPAVGFVGADDVDDAVGADRARVLIVQADARADAGADDERLDVEIAFAHLDHRHDERRHDGGDDDGVDVLHADALVGEQVVDEHAVLVARLLPVRRDAPMLEQFPALIGAEHDVAVADVEY